MKRFQPSIHYSPPTLARLRVVSRLLAMEQGADMRKNAELIYTSLVETGRKKTVIVCRGS